MFKNIEINGIIVLFTLFFGFLVGFGVSDSLQKNDKHPPCFHQPYKYGDRVRLMDSFYSNCENIITDRDTDNCTYYVQTRCKDNNITQYFGQTLSYGHIAERL